MCWRGVGFVHHSRTIFYRAVPNPDITIRNFFIAVREQESRVPTSCGRSGGRGHVRRGVVEEVLQQRQLVHLRLREALCLVVAHPEAAAPRRTGGRGGGRCWRRWGCRLSGVNTRLSRVNTRLSGVNTRLSWVKTNAAVARSCELALVKDTRRLASGPGYVPRDRSIFATVWTLALIRLS
jgi:hypothetical protein